VIARYDVPEVAAVWSDEARMSNWLEIELLAVEAWAAVGAVPADAAMVCRDRGAFTVNDVLKRERVTRHDVAAFVDVVAASIGDEGRWIHFGLTSSDVLDTGFAMQLRAAADVLLADLERLLAVVKRRALEHRQTVCIGRTHGVHAEPTSFGHKLAVFAFQLDRDRERLRRAREAVSVGAISGVVGSYASVDPRVEEIVCGRLGLRASEASTQVIQRDRHAEYVAALAVCGSTLDALATEIRHLARTEVREVQEPFAEGQKGSSAMPHKRNPVVSERVSGLARVIRGHAVTAFENVALWHERDISHSSAERMIFPDATGLLAFMLRDMTGVVDGLVVFPERMREQALSLGGIAFSQSVLLALVDAGLARDEAYRIVQRAAARAWDEEGSFREIVVADPAVTARLDASALEALFDPERFLRNVGPVFDRLEKLQVEVA
jgi:adenylosuccinate lyase